MLKSILKYLPQKIKQSNRLLNIKPTPENIYSLLKDYGYTAVGYCYENCFQAVVKYEIAEKYVLCIIQEKGKADQGHAVISIDGKYYDPTLERHRFANQPKYIFVREFTKKQLVEYVSKSNENREEYNEAGEKMIFPPAVLEDGRVACVEVKRHLH